MASNRPNNPVYRTKRWRDLRAVVLAEEPVCHWCRRRKSTQADHITELDRGGDPYDRANLVGSCATCNGSRGARYGNRKRAVEAHNETTRPATRKRPSEAATGRVEAPETDSLGGPPVIPCAPVLIPPRGRKRTDSAASEPISDYRRLTGSAEPRLVVPVPSGTTNYGTEVTEWAKRVCGVELMPWQVRVCSDVTAHRVKPVDGPEWCFTRALISTGRQNGKSVVLRMYAGWFLTEEAARRGHPVDVLLVSNRLDRTMPMFRQLADTLETGFGATVRRGNGQASITMPDGSTLRVAAARDNVHGFSLDLVLVDEVWDVLPAVLFDALYPSTVARRNAQVLMWSTAGDDSSAAMTRIRETALANIDAGEPKRLYFAEWSVDPAAATGPEDRTQWVYANPALGYSGLSWATLEDEWESNDRTSFLRAHLNMWVAAVAGWLPAGMWDRQQTTTPMPAGGVLAVDQSLFDAGRFVGVRAVSTEAGVQVHVEFTADSTDRMVAEIERVMADKTVALRVTPGLDIHIPQHLHRRMEIRGYREMVTYTSIVRNMITEGRVWHTGQRALAEHVARAVAVKSQTALVLSSAKSPGPIELCRCMVWAVADASRPRATRAASFASSR